MFFLSIKQTPDTFLPIWHGWDIFIPLSLLDQILSAEVFSKISKLFAGENWHQSGYFDTQLIESYKKLPLGGSKDEHFSCFPTSCQTGLSKRRFFYYDKRWNGKRCLLANVDYFWHLMWKTFCHLDGANSIKTALWTCNLWTEWSVTYKSVNWFWLNLPLYQNSKKVFHIKCQK